jgi:hypothetical protein
LENPRFDAQGNKGYFNYCKMYINSRSPERAAYCERIEMQVRFLSGSFLASALMSVWSLILIVLFALAENWDGVFFYFLLLLPMLIVSVAILERFRSQHAREVFHTWIAFHECLDPDNIRSNEIAD